MIDQHARVGSDRTATEQLVTLQEEGEDIMDMDRIDADYVAIPELDTYDDADLDRREYGNMDFSDRRAAERELTERYEAWRMLCRLV